MGERFFRGIHFTGLANIEFKRDSRDGQLKVIECNPRFTAAQELLVESGLDTAILTYCRITKQHCPITGEYRDNTRLIEPIRDYFSYRQLKAMKEITFSQWLSSILHKSVISYFRWYDPLPAMALLFSVISKAISKNAVRLFNNLGFSRTATRPQ